MNTQNEIRVSSNGRAVYLSPDFMSDMLALDDGLDLKISQFGVAFDFHELYEEVRAKAFKENTTKQKYSKLEKIAANNLACRKIKIKKRKKKQINCSRCSNDPQSLPVCIALRQKNASKAWTMSF